MLFLA
jgi:hypothetical protein